MTRTASLSRRSVLFAAYRWRRAHRALRTLSKMLRGSHLSLGFTLRKPIRRLRLVNRLAPAAKDTDRRRREKPRLESPKAEMCGEPRRPGQSAQFGVTQSWKDDLVESLKPFRYKSDSPPISGLSKGPHDTGNLRTAKVTPRRHPNIRQHLLYL
jgi:hypothetical protein